ncbi:Hypothetical_protein [Hexamita inflata]|uniref:Hypothetical_protein n=1 Tax=Hexamita inflata TaxID=28002 RepID=A0AA86QFG2_9EUKA|nr:Hypothetical protein HINF_LOCUS45936 [Hexamita inflata]
MKMTEDTRVLQDRWRVIKQDYITDLIRCSQIGSEFLVFGDHFCYFGRFQPPQLIDFVYRLLNTRMPFLSEPHFTERLCVFNIWKTDALPVKPRSRVRVLLLDQSVCSPKTKCAEIQQPPLL